MTTSISAHVEHAFAHRHRSRRHQDRCDHACRPMATTLFEKRIARPSPMTALIGAIAGLSQEAAKAAGGDATVGIGSPGSASPQTGLWRNANSCSAMASLCRRSRTAIALARQAENDANCFALSEAHDGAGAGYGGRCLLHVGTALGGGLVIDGRLRSGPNARSRRIRPHALPWPNDSEWPLLPVFAARRAALSNMFRAPGLRAITIG